MTKNQIDFAKHKEDQRHNLEMEKQGVSKIGEEIRHNQQSEAINWFTGSSLAGLQSAQAGKAQAETGAIGEELAIKRRDSETKASEAAERERHNKESESLQQSGIAADMISGIGRAIIGRLGG